ncbi:Aldehyde dehydrogenase [Aphelenchoides bicaudatus]|nr:Aldehyde dehydrogenase [Aphelenchoides bicaudatus]
MSYRQLVEGQREFFKSGATRSLEFRREQLLKLRKAIVKEADAIKDAIHRDLRRPPEMTQLVEINGSLTEIDYVLENLKDWMKPEYVEKTMANLLDTPMVVREPYGVCLLITTWNYPALMFFYPLISMLAAGNTVIIKASEVSVSSSSLISELLARTFHKDIVAVVQGDAQAATDLLGEHFDKIMYTGSTPIGSLIMKAAAKNVTPVVLELGGKCPVIVESDADLQITAKRLVWGKLFNAGQTCVAPDYIITTPRVKQQLIPLLSQTIRQFYGQNVQESKDYIRIINERHFDRGESDRSDLFIPPVIVDCEVDDPVMRDELFGPILPIITVDSATNDGIRLINKGREPLTTYIFTRDDKKVQRLIKETQSGSVLVNDVLMHYGVDTLPFGGVGFSGMGSYRGRYGFEEFSHSKAVLVRGFFGDGLASARYPPLTESSYRKLTQLLQRRSIPKIFSWLRPSIPSLIFGVVFGHATYAKNQTLDRIFLWQLELFICLINTFNLFI